ncbi:hypothetical protein O9G_001187 [Rozella allomycis CSF55]|uniref:F-box domain-containing protein n=1 Tax=Rozella allomycis (strain CSF55) TaxID=988480 RepID=A0A075ASI3_ROZAC|nr:hypothetical protein O9G_001187 [Rozella allomycis CSF55]|eukprot:EPZ33218.1 hypothetical protein O9G_001187 [Rozella allomycis CSF55]
MTTLIVSFLALILIVSSSPIANKTKLTDLPNELLISILSKLEPEKSALAVQPLNSRFSNITQTTKPFIAAKCNYLFQNPDKVTIKKLLWMKEELWRVLPYALFENVDLKSWCDKVFKTITKEFLPVESIKPVLNFLHSLYPFGVSRSISFSKHYLANTNVSTIIDLIQSYNCDQYISLHTALGIHDKMIINVNNEKLDIERNIKLLCRRVNPFDRLRFIYLVISYDEYFPTLVKYLFSPLNSKSMLINISKYISIQYEDFWISMVNLQMKDEINVLVNAGLGHVFLQAGILFDNIPFLNSLNITEKQLYRTLSVDPRLPEGEVTLLHPLMYALWGFKFNSAEWLIERGLTPDKLNSRGEDIVHACIRYGMVLQTVWLLEKFPRKINERSTVMTPLMVAIEFEMKDAYLALIKMGADVSVPDLYGNYPIHYAMESEMEDFFFLRHLISMGADIRSLNCDGMTALHYSIQNKNIKLVRILLDIQPDLLNTRNAFGELPEQYLSTVEADDDIKIHLQIIKARRALSLY